MAKEKVKEKSGGGSAFERLSQSGKGKGISETSVGGKQRLKIESLLDFADFSDGEYRTGRIYPVIFAMATHYYDIVGNDGKTFAVGKVCKRFDPETQEFDSTKKCWFCEFQNKMKHTDYFTGETKDQASISVRYFFNYLNRDKQENLPKKLRETDEELESGFKDKTSNSITPLEVVSAPAGLIEKFKKLQRVGKKETKLDDPEKGRDISILFDKNEKVASNKWDAQKADEPGEPLSKKEKGYLLWDIKSAIIKMQESTTLDEDKIEAEKAMAAAKDTKGKKSKDKSKEKGGKSKGEDEDEVKGKKSKDKSKDKGGKASKEEDEPKGKKAKDKVADEPKGKGKVKEEEEPKGKGKGKAKEEEPKGKGKKAKDEEPEAKGKGKKSKVEEEPKGKKEKGSSKFDIDEDEEKPKDKKKKK